MNVTFKNNDPEPSKSTCPSESTHTLLRSEHVKANGEFRRAVNNALKHKLPAGLKDPDALQRQAYDALNAYLTEHQDDVLEIDILPPTFPIPNGDVILQDGPCLGVPKHILILAQPTASEIFWALPTTDGTSSNTTAAKYNAARILLLMQTENLSAANFLKRRIRQIEAQEPAPSLQQAVHRDLLFLNSILTSPLHRHSKSPTLWYHRQWLLQYLLPGKLADPSAAQLVAFVKAEIHDVCKASERHPKNYTAWDYARRLLREIASRFQDNALTSQSYHHLLSYCVSYVREWCFKNPSDTSGWSFLLFLLPWLTDVRERLDVVEQVLRYAERLQWKQESLWAFVRTVLADDVLGDEREVAIQTLVGLTRGVDRDWRGMSREEAFQRCMGQSLEWVQTYGAPLSKAG